MSRVADQLAAVNRRIASACQAAGRATDAVQLLAVSKTKPMALVEQAYAAGQRQFGENYLQDALEKISACTLADIQWHFIGAIQSNKTAAITAHFAWVHTLERGKIAQRLNDQRPPHLPPLKVLIQVNISAEANKAGVAVADIAPLAEAIENLPRLQLCGLMCIPAATSDPAEQRHAFAALAAARDALRPRFPGLTELSMGMSADLEQAIAAGATQVRIGTDIFGARAPKPQ